MFFEGLVIARFVDREIALTGHLDGQFQGEAIGLVEVEGFATADDFLFDVWWKFIDHFVEFALAAFECGSELFLFKLEFLEDDIVALCEFRIDIAVLFDYDLTDLGAERAARSDTEPATFTHCPPDEAPQDVTLAEVGRRDVCCQNKGRRPQVLGNDAAAAVLARIGMAG